MLVVSVFVVVAANHDIVVVIDVVAGDIVIVLFDSLLFPST